MSDMVFMEFLPVELENGTKKDKMIHWAIILFDYIRAYFIMSGRNDTKPEIHTKVNKLVHSALAYIEKKKLEKNINTIYKLLFMRISYDKDTSVCSNSFAVDSDTFRFYTAAISHALSVIDHDGSWLHPTSPSSKYFVNRIIQKTQNSLQLNPSP